jgi:hypothetical protein
LNKLSFFSNQTSVNVRSRIANDCTSVIDPSTNTLYVVAAVQNSSDTAMFYYLFAVALQERSRELQGYGGYYGEKLEIEYALAEPASSRKDEMTAEETLNKPVCLRCCVFSHARASLRIRFSRRDPLPWLAGDQRS